MFAGRLIGDVHRASVRNARIQRLVPDSKDHKPVMGIAEAFQGTHRSWPACQTRTTNFLIDFKQPGSGQAMKNVPAEEDAWWRHFQELLDDQIDFPDEYLFKFIVPAHSLNALKNIFGRHPVTVRASSKGRYLSVTAKMEMHSSDEIVALYQAAAKVDQVMML